MKLLLKLSLAFIFSVLLTACGSNAEDVFVEARVIAVNVAPAATGDIRSELSFAGRVRAEEHIAVIARLPGGMVDEVLVDVGDFVNAGDILFTMDAVDIQTNVDALAAQLVAAEATVSAARTGIAQADGAMIQQQILAATGGVQQAEMALAQTEAGVEQAMLALSHAESGYNLARQAYEDTTMLFEAGIASRVQLDQAEMAYSSAEFGLEQARAGYNLARLAYNQAGVGHTQALQAYELITLEMPVETVQRARDGYAQAIAARDALIVSLEAVTERLEDATIRAPISGTIGSRGVEPNQMLLPGAPPFTIVSADAVQVGVEVTEVIINHIEPGQIVPVHISSAQEEPFFGTITTVSPAANEFTSTFSVEIFVENYHGLIRPGMFAEVFFVREQASDVIVVPRASVISAGGQHIVYLAEGGVAVGREVTMGIESGAYVQILEGLSPGEPLVVTGQAFLTDGVQLYIVEAGGGNE